MLTATKSNIIFGKWLHKAWELKQTVKLAYHHEQYPANKS